MGVTLKDIAEKAGVSISTVSRVINNDQSRPVSEHTSEIVWNYVDELGYNKHKKNNQQQSTKTKSIGFILNDTPKIYNHPFFSVMLEGLEDEARKQGYSIAFSYTQPDLKIQAIEHKLVNQEEADGVIILAEYIEEKFFKELKDSFKNIVIFDNRNPDIHGYDAINVKRREAAAEVVEYLVKLGHEEIGFIGGILIGSNHNTVIHEDRYLGYADIMKKYNLKIKEKYIKNGDWEMDIAYQKMKEMLELDKLPTAIFVASDYMSIGAMRAIHEAGLEIPEDISIVSYDNIKMAPFTNPPLTTVHVPKEEIGRQLVKTLIDRINGDIHMPLQIIAPTELKIRESAAPPSK
jgi:DNA-binding LacI/PurR family transcriptional regulator